MPKPMMKCGHQANAVRMPGEIPCCAICSGITEDALIIDDNPPDLTSRMAKCADCHRKKKSTDNLAFFRHQPDAPYDQFYCGCRGWN